MHLGEVCDPPGEPVKAAAALRRDPHLDDRRDEAGLHFLLIHDRLVAEHDAVGLELREPFGHHRRGETEFLRQILHGGAGVAAEQDNERIHGGLWARSIHGRAGRSAEKFREAQSGLGAIQTRTILHPTGWPRSSSSHA